MGLGVRGWGANHVLITGAALRSATGIAGCMVEYAPVDDLVKDLGFGSRRTFIESLRIHKGYSFPLKLSEDTRKRVGLLEVLTTYSDEPDWNMDRELFGQDQYPGLWRDEYLMMGGKDGIPSQAFRHMYWKAPSWSVFVPALKLPLSRMFKTMGEAPELAKVFEGISRKSAERGHSYWAARFLANAIHYLEDVGNPFHSTQTSTKRFMLLPLCNLRLGSGFKNYLIQVQNIVGYYHIAFENYVGYLMGDAENGNVTGRELLACLESQGDSHRALSYESRDISALVRNLSGLAVCEAPQLGRAVMKLFPPINVPFETLEPVKLLDDAWWVKMLETAKISGSGHDTCVSIVKRMFTLIGSALRNVVDTFLNTSF